MITIDKSKFTAEQLSKYEELVAIGKADVDPEAAEEEMEDEIPDIDLNPREEKRMVKTKKSAEAAVPAFVQEALAKSAEFMTRIEKQEMTEVAKKYSLLGENPEELGEKLYNLKKSDPTMYESCISMLDKQVSLIEKSGLFAEIGKSTGGTTGSGATAKAEAKAAEIMKADPNMDYNTAIAKAWEDPSLMAEYDSEYFG